MEKLDRNLAAKAYEFKERCCHHNDRRRKRQVISAVT